MQTREVQLFEELRTLIDELGKDGGKITPSIYDTAQRLRFYPPVEGVEPGLEWLLDEQQADGGWCDPAVPAARDAASLAAILALKQYRTDRAAQAAIEAGLAFLRAQAHQWVDIHLDALPIAGEMILPCLLEEAEAAQLGIDLRPYDRLFQLRSKKQKYMTKAALQAGSASTYSWEALNLPATPNWLDATGGVGHSPAATAKWLQLTADRPELASYRVRAEDYLSRAQAATDTSIPGLVPVVFPITGFELSYGAFAVLSAGLLFSPELTESLSLLARQMQGEMMIQRGFTFGESFEPDADSTAVATAALAALGQPVDGEYLLQFEKEDGFATFHQELNASIISNAHALCALAILGRRHTAAEVFLLDRQRAGGEWFPDKWHSSWLYSTLESTLAFALQDRVEDIENVVDVLEDAQHADGGWGTGLKSTVLETSYAVLTLSTLQHLSFADSTHEALAQGRSWLDTHIVAEDGAYQSKRWLSKELYRPCRVDRIYELCARLTGQSCMESLSHVKASVEYV